MLNQSFSADNFLKIYEDENRKGNDLASRFFPKVKEKNNDIRNENIKLRNKKIGLNKEQKAEIREKIRLLKENRDVELKSYLENLEQAVLANTKASFKINLTKDDSITSKPVYLIDKDDVVSYFIIKQIQRNIRKLYKVKQSDRHQIVSQLSLLLNNKFPKHLIRTDIKEFYESIPHNGLLEIIEHENLLSHTCKQYVKSILNKYKILSGSDKGLPRGIGMSAYLAELYMRDFDRKVKLDDEMIFYGRYVDDIVALYAPKPDSDISLKITDINNWAIEKGLSINKTKTKEIPLSSPSEYKFDYLGYQFQSKKNPNLGYIFTLDMSYKKLKKYIHRVKSTFTVYSQTPSKYQRKASKSLIQRVSFLTSNTKLYGNKSGTLIGIHFSNKLITKLERIELLDKCLTNQINCLSDPAVKARLSSLNFKWGFETKKFHKFNTYQIKKIVKAWG